MVDDNQDSSSDFNVEAFVDKIYETIDSYRSQIGLQEGSVIEHPSDGVGGKNNAESKINCFYRLLGLPAVRADLADKKFEDESLSQHYTLNYFADFKVDRNSVGAAAAARETESSQPLTAQASIDMVNDILPFTAAINKSSRRSSLFPMVVSAAVPVFPTSRRTAPLFYPGEFTIDGKSIKLTRPFLEHVFYIRNKANSGGGDQSLFDSLSKEVQGANFSLDPNLANKLLELRIVSKLVKCLRSVAKSWVVLGEDINRLKKDVLFVPAPKSNPAERAGNMTSLGSDVKVPEITEKNLENIIQTLSQQLAKEESLLASLPSEAIKSADRIARIDQDNPNLNIVDDAIISEFQSLIMFERDSIAETLKETKAKKSRLLDQFEKARKLLIYLNGEGTGLSIIDIVCVLLALFTVDNSVLVGLVNPKSRNDLLENDRFYRSQNPQSSDQTSKNESSIEKLSPTPGFAVESIERSVSALQGKVKENFSLLEVFVKNAKETGSDA